jgi:GDPmannose 4,6-dehydratase
MRKRALICGISGQDGAYLAQLLLARHYEVWGTSRDAEAATFANLRQLGIYDEVHLVSLNLRDMGNSLHLLRTFRPHEIYSLAGQSSVSLSFEQPVETFGSVALGTLSLLEAMRIAELRARLYNAGSTESFGETGEHAATEETPMRPCSPYGVAKASAYWIVDNYRRAYGMHACTGILSNHDSPLRPKRFVTRKIIRAVAELARGSQVRLALGNLHIERDWGWAPEYVEAIWLMLQQKEPADYVIATGKTYSLTEFVAAAFAQANLNWREHVDIDATLMRPSDLSCTHVNPARAAEQLGWRAQHDMHSVVAMMYKHEAAQMAKGAAA